LEWLHLTQQLLGFSFKGANMQRINVQYFYRLATILRPLSQVSEGPLMDSFGVLYAAESELQSFLWNTIIPPETSFATGYELYTTVKELTDQIGQADATLSVVDVNKINAELTRFETVLQADFARRDMFAVSKKGIFSTTDLVENAEAMLPKAIQEKIPEAVKDMHSAGRCIAFELATAAGFHIFRAVEAVGREYVTIVRGAPPTDKEKNLGLGGYKKILEDHGADPRVINALDQLRKLHRNPTMHPEITLTTDEVISTLGLAQSVIQAMVADMEKFRPNPEPAIAQTLPQPLPEPAEAEQENNKRDSESKSATAN
jgi:hypothetical protein